MFLIFLYIIAKVYKLFKLSYPDFYDEIKCKMIIMLCLYFGFMIFRLFVSIVCFDIQFKGIDDKLF